MTASLAGVFNPQQFTSTGALADSYRLYTYIPNTTTHRNVFTDAAGATPHTYTSDGAGGQYIGLNARGELPAGLYLTASVDLCLKTPAGSTIWTRFAAPTSLGADELRTDLASAVSSTLGPALVGYGPTIAYGAGTVGAWMRRFVFVADYGTDLTAFQTAIDRAETLGGGIVMAAPGQSYTGNVTGTALQLKVGVHVDLNQATLVPTFTWANAIGVRGHNYSSIRNGYIAPVQGVSPSSSLFYHAPVVLGVANGAGGTIASPSTYSVVHDFECDLVVTPSRDFGPCFQGVGECYNNRIRIRVGNSSKASGIHWDWGDRGTGINSSDIAGSRVVYDAGTAITTHPHDNHSEIIAGVLSITPSGGLGAHGVRLSGCYNMTSVIQVDSCTMAAYTEHAGDLGAEFAASAVRPLLQKGNEAWVKVLAPTSAFLDGAYISTLADNIYTAQTAATPYTPAYATLLQGDITVHMSAVGPLVASGYGVRTIQARGVRIRGTIQKFDVGALIDEFSQDIDLEDYTISGCRSHGWQIGAAALREDTIRVNVRRGRSYGNGVSGTGYGGYVARGTDLNIEDNVFGTSDEATQDIGLVIADALNKNVSARRNHVAGATVAAYSAALATAPHYHDQLGVWTDNTADSAIPQAPIAALGAQVPTASQTLYDRRIKTFATNVTGDPSVGNWTRGSVLWRTDATTAEKAATSCTISGSKGTLNGLTNCATTNTSKSVTMSLTATTATVTTAGDYSCVVASATNLRVGLLCTITGGVTDARILSISGTTLQLDKPSKAVTAAAFTTAGVIEGEVISINTATPSTGIVMSVTGTTVVLDTAASSTETGRTVSYVAPVFKAHAVIA